MALFEAPAPMQAMIASVISRCRSAGTSGAVISVTLSCVEACEGMDRSRFGFSVSDNGPSVIGEWMDDFCRRLVADPSTLDHADILWDRTIELSTPDMAEKKMRNYQLRFVDNSSPQLLELRPQWREKRTLLSMLIDGPTLETVSYFKNLLEKFAIPTIEGVFLEWHYVSRRGERETFQSREFIAKETSEPTTGFLNYLHRHRLPEACHGDSDTLELVNVGEGVSDNPGFRLHAFVALTVQPMASSAAPTKIMYFEDFVYSPVPSSMLQLLSKVDWMKFNLSVRFLDMETAAIAWELSKAEPTDIILLKVTKSGRRSNSRCEAKQLKQAVEGALYQLKRKLPHLLASPQATKMMSCVPDLARCIAGLIKSSTDVSFVGECTSLMGLLPAEVDKLEDQIKAKLSTIVTTADNTSTLKASVCESSAREAGSGSDESDGEA